MADRLSSPLGLREQLGPRKSALDAFPVLDVLLIAIAFALMGSRFVVAPGVPLDLPRSETYEAGLTTSALTLDGRDRIYYDGRIFRLEEFERYQPAGELKGVLLIEADRAVNLDVFLAVCSRARQLGYEEVRIATLPAVHE